MIRTLLLILALTLAFPVLADGDPPPVDDCAESARLAEGWEELADRLRAFERGENATQKEAEALVELSIALTEDTVALYGRTQERFEETDHVADVLERLSGAEGSDAIDVMSDMASALERLSIVCDGPEEAEPNDEPSATP